MAAHLARSAQQRRVAILAIALVAGAMAFAYAGSDDRRGGSPTGTPAPSVTTDASVLGVVITQPELPAATPASPVEVGDSDGPSPTSTGGTGGTTTQPPASLVPPTFIENTTSTTDGTTTPTIDLSTTTSTEAPSTTTTEVPPG